MKNQRLYKPYLKNGETFSKIEWSEAYKILTEKIQTTSPEKIAGITGDLTNMETLYIIKEFFNKTIKSKYLDCRHQDLYINNNDRKNYLFNSLINGIEESDLILLLSTNPRYEATILNARIRKSYINNNTVLQL